MTDGYTTPPQSQHPGAGPGGQPATVGQRFLAKLIDWVLITVVVSVVVVTVLIGAIADGDVSAIPLATEVDGSTIVISIISAVLTIAYFALLECRRGQTVGKMALGLEVRSSGGGHPTLEAAIKRNLWMALPVIPVLGGVAQLGAAIAIAVTVSNSTTGSGWHDDFAGGTTVIKR